MSCQTPFERNDFDLLLLKIFIDVCLLLAWLYLRLFGTS